MLRILQRSLLHRPIYQFRYISSIPTPSSTSHTASASSPSSSPSSTSPPSPPPPRVRFAPSPTGDLHLGGLRTALFNWLLARQHPLGKFILRIEDTDQTRSVPGAIEQIQRVLKWAGLDYDEGPDRPGPYGPYIQSQRLPLYKQYAMQLVAQGHAYPCTCTSERLEAMRASHIARHINWMYDRHCAHYTVEEQMSRMEKAQRDGTPFVIRMKVPSGHTTVHDAVRPTQIVDNQSIDDQVLLKSDGFPTYHLAVVVDDHLMRITHALRGEEWRSSTPKHIILYDMLGWEKPIYVHLPLIFNADGSKLSKRDGGASAESYIREGYHPDAVINALSLPGLIKTDDKYIYTRKQLIEQFSISAIGTSGGQFDVKKLRHINAEHKRMLLEKDATSLHQTIRTVLTTTYPHLTITDDQITTLLLDVLKERVVTAKEFIEQTRWYFQAPDFTTEKAQKARSIVFKNETDTKSLLSLIHTSLSSLPEWSNFDPWFHTFLKQHGLKLPQLGQPMRFVLTGDIHGPSVASLLHALGRDESLARISAHL